MERINLTFYPVKFQISLLKLNRKVQVAMVESKSWEDLKNTICALAVVSEDALKFFEEKYKRN